MFLDQPPNALYFVVPASRANYHILARADAGLDVGDDAGRRGEIDDYVDAVQPLHRESGPAAILRRAFDTNVVSTLARHFCYQRSGLSAPE